MPDRLSAWRQKSGVAGGIALVSPADGLPADGSPTVVLLRLLASLINNISRYVHAAATSSCLTTVCPPFQLYQLPVQHHFCCGSAQCG